MTAVAPYADEDVVEIVDRVGSRLDPLAGKTLLVSGASGFIGTLLTAAISRAGRTVLSEPCRIIATDIAPLRGQAARSVDRFIEHDIRYPLSVDEHIDYVIHAAGIPSPAHYRAKPVETIEIAVLGSQHLLSLAVANSSRYLFFSSSEIYGDPDPNSVPTPETYRGNVACQGPRACYDESKRLGETLAYVAAEQHGLHVNIVRPFNVFGPGMPENDSRVLPSFVSRILRGVPLAVYGTGSQTRTFCYVTDAVVGFLLVLLHGLPGETYNIGNPAPEITMAQLIDHLERTHGAAIAWKSVDYPDGYPGDEPRRRCPDVSKASAQLGYQPVVGLDLGLRRFLSWAERAYTSSR